MSVLKKFRKSQKSSFEGTWASTDNKPTHKTRKGGVQEWETQGAWRRDEDGTYYYFTSEQLDDIDRLNDQVPAGKEGDAEFWRLFREYRESQGVTSSRNADARSEWMSGGSKWKWTDALKGAGGALSSYWTGWSGKFLSSEMSQRVALALRAVSTTVNVIDDSGIKMRVHAASPEHNVSFTDFERNRIVVSVKPLLDASIKDDGQAIDIMTGYGLHESSHSKKKGSREYYKRIGVMPPPLRPRGLAATLLNVVEDVRIEADTASEFPGFAAYLDKMNEYVWVDCKVPAEYGPDLTSKMNAVIGIVKWPKQTEPLAAKYLGEFEWWRKWAERYSPDTNLIPHLQEAIDHLREDENGDAKGEANDQIDELTKGEEEIEKMRQDLEAAINHFLSEMGKDLNDFCTHRPHDEADQVDESDAEEIERHLNEDLTREKSPIKMPNGAENPDIYISRPTETNESVANYSDKADAMLARYKSALIFRPARPQHTITLLREGDICEDELWRWATDDWRVFEEKDISRDPNVRCYLLVDISGSMAGEKVMVAQRMARLFVDALRSIHGVTPKVYAHTGDLGAYGSYMYRIWEQGDPMTRLGLIGSLQMGNNYDGHALAWVAKTLNEEALPGEQKFIIVLSDGLPAGAIGYGGDEGMAHVREVVTDAQRRKDIRVLQIAIDPEMDEVRQSAMYDEYITFHPGDSLDRVPGRLTKWLTKIL